MVSCSGLERMRLGIVQKCSAGAMSGEVTCRNGTVMTRLGAVWKSYAVERNRSVV